MAGEPKIYAPGNVKSRQLQFGEVLSFGFSADKMIAFIQQHKNEKGYVNLDITPKREVDQYGNSHSVTLNTWVRPEGGQPRQSSPAAQQHHRPQQAPAPNKNIGDDYGGGPPF